MTISRRLLLGSALGGAAAYSMGARPSFAQGAPIKVGILHSLSGTMAISETTLKDVMLMLIEQQNARGGVLGRRLEPVVVDPASNWPLFAEKARELITGGCSAVFGCWTSVSRKSVLPVFKELNNILFYPVQYEGEESERNVFYTGAAPEPAGHSRRRLPDVEGWRRGQALGAGRHGLCLPAHHQQDPRGLPARQGRRAGRHHDQLHAVRALRLADHRGDIKRFGSAGKKTAVVSTINGDANVPFYKELGNQGVKATDIPVVAFSVGEEELAGIDTRPLLGHLAAWNYFQSVKDPANEAFIKAWKAFKKNDKAVTNDPMEAHVIGFNMWIKAIEKAKSVAPDAVIEALPGIKQANLTGGVSEMLPNHHITKPVLIGEVRADGQFDVVWQTKDLVPGDAWTDHLPGSRDLEADWVTRKCGNWNRVTNRCGA